MNRRQFLLTVGAATLTGAEFALTKEAPARVLPAANGYKFKCEVSQRLWEIYQAHFGDLVDEVTRASIRKQASTYLEGLVADRTIRSYKVVCSDVNNPPVYANVIGFDVYWEQSSVDLRHFFVRPEVV